VLATEPEALGPLTVTAARPHGGGMIVAFAGISDRGAAQRLRGTKLVIDSADIPPPADPDEFYDYQLIGLDVLTVDGARIGRVTEVRHHGQDLLVVRREDRTIGDHDDADRMSPGRGTADGVAASQAGIGHGDNLPAGHGNGPDSRGAGPAAGGTGHRPAGRARPAGGGGAGDDLLVPFVAALVPEVDLRARRLVIDPPPGLLDPADAD
jgi:ribosomal 30S subunit maturation factor RimM